MVKCLRWLNYCCTMLSHWVSWCYFCIIIMFLKNLRMFKFLVIGKPKITKCTFMITWKISLISLCDTCTNILQLSWVSFFSFLLVSAISYSIAIIKIDVLTFVQPFLQACYNCCSFTYRRRWSGFGIWDILVFASKGTQ